LRSANDAPGRNPAECRLYIRRSGSQVHEIVHEAGRKMRLRFDGSWDMLIFPLQAPILDVEELKLEILSNAGDD